MIEKRSIQKTKKLTVSSHYSNKQFIFRINGRRETDFSCIWLFENTIPYHTEQNSSFAFFFSFFYSPCIWTNKINSMRCHYGRLLINSATCHNLFLIILNLFLSSNGQVVSSLFLVHIQLNINILYRILTKNSSWHFMMTLILYVCFVKI